MGMGKIQRSTPKNGERELTIEASFAWDSPLICGESIAVSGVCLTVTQLVGKQGFTAHASEETLSHSTLGRVKTVNLERALALGGRLGGHLVSGHIDGLAQVLKLEKAGKSLVFTFGVAGDMACLIVPKGSVTIDGVSLTTNQVGPDFFTINIIPHTAELTTLGTLKAGDMVNLETDLLGKYVHKFLQQGQKQTAEGSLTRDFLARNGF